MIDSPRRLPWLTGVHVVDVSDTLAGRYASRLLKDAGATVTRAEEAPARVDVAVTGGSAPALDALLTMLTDGDDVRDGAAVRSAIEHADVVLCGAASWTGLALEQAARARPELTVVAISDTGLDGPAAGQELDSCLRQALSGSLYWRGDPDRPPVMAAGEIEHYLGGAYAAAAVTAGLRLARRTGAGEVFDLSLLEVCNTGLTTFGATLASMAGRLGEDFPRRSVQIPAIERTVDGWVGLCTISARQRQDLMHIIGRSDLADDESVAYAGPDTPQAAELKAAIAAWAAERTTAEVVDIASAMRIPVAPVGRGSTLLDNEQLRARGFLHGSASGDVGRGTPFRFYHTAVVPHRRSGRDARPGHEGDEGLPLAGLRVVDLTAWWAGPATTHLFAAMGADVVKVESTARPDGMRYSFVPDPDAPNWWDWGPVFFALNTNKRGITLDFTTERGRAILQELVERADVLIENFTPRVLDSIGIDWDHVHEVNPGIVVARMPAFGLDGPWRDRSGFAQTIEQSSGLAWTTGHGDGAPVAPRGVCDPLAGMHAAFACLAALEYRDRHGVAGVVETSMLETAVYAAFGQVLAWQREGEELGRIGNRHPYRCPRGVYPTGGEDEWIAVNVGTAAQWTALAGLLGRPGWQTGPWPDEAYRRDHADEIDAAIARWCRDRSAEQVVADLGEAGVPGVRVTGSGRVPDHPQFRHRGFFEWVDHPVTGSHPVPGLPFRARRGPGRWNRRPAPTLGQDTREVLGDWLAMSEEEIAELERSHISGTRPLHLETREPA
jgi:crotonobetainyl-CoA:carnitine CoA-transferase CaiB-like acyl-CoA transferase